MSSFMTEFLEKKEARNIARRTWKEFLKDEAAVQKMLENVESFFRGIPEGRVLSSLPLPDELDCLQLLRRFSFPVYIPRVVDKEGMQFHMFSQGNQIVSRIEIGYGGVPGPESSSPILELPLTKKDTVLVPSLACDRAGARLGRGAGYYDRWKDRMTEALKIAVIPSSLCGLGFSSREYDLQLNKIITEKALVEFR